LQEILGDCVLEAQNCNGILSLPIGEYCNHNMSMRKSMAAQAKLPTSPKQEANSNKESKKGKKKSIVPMTRMQLRSSKNWGIKK